LYNANCANCHMQDGSGLAGVIPPMAGADWIAEDPVRQACVIRYGLEEEIVVNGVTYNQPMAGIDKLSKFEITNIINYVNHAWGNDWGYVQLDEVEAALQACEE